MQLETGYNGELLAVPLILQDNVTNSWIKHVWVSTQEYRVTILMDFAEYPPQQGGDIKLMQCFVQHGWKQPKLKVLNQCRLYLKVFLLLDIVLSSSIAISAQFWE